MSPGRLVLCLAACLGPLVAAALLPGPAAAQQPAPSAQQGQEEADVLVARAVLAYEEKRYQDALAALQEALQADPENADAFYYTGLVRVALGQPEQAIEALEKARALHPTDDAIRFQLGVAYFSLQKYDQAQPLLEAVFTTNPRLDGLGYYVGFMRYRTKNYQGALQAFRAGASTDPNIQQLVAFYSGLALGILGQPGRAAAEIAEATRLNPASPITGPAERLAATILPPGDKPLRLEARVGGLWDDNVAVIPQNSPDPLVQILRNQKHTSPGWLSSLRAEYDFLRRGSGRCLETDDLRVLTASYSTYSSQNNDVNRVSVVDNLGGLAATYCGALETRFGLVYYKADLPYNYDYLTLNGDEFVTRHTVQPAFALREGDGNLTYLLARYQHKRYAFSANPIQAEKRDGSNYMVGVLQRITLSSWFLPAASGPAPGAPPPALDVPRILSGLTIKLGYQLDYDLLQGANFTYVGNRFQGGGEYAFFPTDPRAPKEIWSNMRLSYDFDAHLRRYRNFNTRLPILAPNTKPREDNEFNHIVRLTYPLAGPPEPLSGPYVGSIFLGGNVAFLTDLLAKWKIPGSLQISADYVGTVAKSNMEAFTFNRNNVSVSLVWSWGWDPGAAPAAAPVAPIVPRPPAAPTR